MNVHAAGDAPVSGKDGVASRLVALEMLDSVLRRRRSFDDVLEGHEGFRALEGRDRGFVRLLVATVLRRLGELDTVATAMLERPPEQLKPAAVLDVLRLGAAQVLFLGTPPHAAVDTSVALAAAGGFEHQKGLVNAVMRRIVREGAGLLAQLDARRVNVPDWIWNTLVFDYGVETALHITQASLTEAPLDITVRKDPVLWAQRLEAEILPTGTLRRREGGGPVAGLPGFAEGAWWIQDMAAAIPAQLLGDVRGQTVIDLCAAPGGKTAQLACAGARVVAVDRAARRMERLRENLTRLRLEAETVVADGAVWRPEALADAVLLDAPCTATGAIRRNPDVLRLKQPEDLAKLVSAQQKLLANALEMVRPGGLVVYCVCSVLKDEGERQVEAVLQAGQARRVPVADGELGGLGCMINENGDVRSLPFMLAEQGGIDGFFIARLLRN